MTSLFPSEFSECRFSLCRCQVLLLIKGSTIGRDTVAGLDAVCASGVLRYFQAGRERASSYTRVHNVWNSRQLCVSPLLDPHTSEYFRNSLTHRKVPPKFSMNIPARHHLRCRGTFRSRGATSQVSALRVRFSGTVQ